MLRRPRNIVFGQHVSDDKKAFARDQRRQMSPVERALWNRLRGNQLHGYHFRRQQIVGNYIADFYCARAGLAVEVDGETHDDPERDRRRDAAFAARGIRVLRFTNAQVLHEMDAVLEVIAAALLTSP